MTPADRMVLMADLAACVVTAQADIERWCAANVLGPRRQHPALEADLRATLAVVRIRAPLTGGWADAWLRWVARLERILGNLTADATPAEYEQARDGLGAPTVRLNLATWN